MDKRLQRNAVPLEWLRHARSDLALARIDPPPGVLYQQLCFHAQQAVEKAMKAVILHVAKKEPPYSHNIRRLMHEIKMLNQSAPPVTIEEAVLLTQYAVETRYPDDFVSIEEEEWRRSVAVASGVVDWAEGLIGKKL